MNTADGSLVRIYELQPESLLGNTLKARAAFSFSGRDGKDPVFGTFWMVAHVETDRDSRLVRIASVKVKVPNVKLAPQSDVVGLSLNYLRAEMETDYLKTELETGILRLNLDLSLDALLASLDMSTGKRICRKGLIRIHLTSSTSPGLPCWC